MPTLREKVRDLKAKGRSGAQTRAAMEKAFGVPVDELIPLFDNDVRDIPGILQSKYTYGPEKPPDKDLKPPEKDDFVERFLEATPIPKPPTYRPATAFETVKRGAGFAKGLATAAGDIVADYFTDDTEAQDVGTVAQKVYEAQQKEMDERLEEEGLMSRIGTDILDVVSALPKVFVAATTPPVIAEGEDMIAAGEKLGRATVGALAGSAASFAEDPLETMAVAPVSAAIEAGSLIVPALATVKAAGLGQKIATLSKIIPDTDLGKKLSRAAGDIVDTVSKKTQFPKQVLLDRLDAGDPEITKMVEDVVEDLDLKVAGAMKATERFTETLPEKLDATAGKRKVTGGAVTPTEVAVRKEQPVDENMRKLGLGLEVEGPRLKRESLPDAAKEALADIEARLTSIGGDAGGVEDAISSALFDLTLSAANGRQRKLIFKKLKERGLVQGYGNADQFFADTLALGPRTVLRSDVPALPPATTTFLTPGAAIAKAAKGKKALTPEQLAEKLSEFFSIDIPDIFPKEARRRLQERAVATAVSDVAEGLRAARVKEYLRDAASTTNVNKIIGDYRDSGRLPVAFDNQLKEAVTDAAQSEPKLAAHVAKMEEVPGTGILVDPKLGYALRVGDKVAEAQQRFEPVRRVLNTILSDFPKKSALAFSSRAITNNLIGNELMTSVRYGEVPFAWGVPRIAEARKYMRYKKGLYEKRPRRGEGVPLLDVEGKRLNVKAKLQNIQDRLLNVTEEDVQFFRSMEKAGLLDTDQIGNDIKRFDMMADLVESAKTSPSSIKAAAGEVAGVAGGALPKLMELGDEVYKVYVARKEYDRAGELLDLLKDNQYLDLPVSPTARVRVTKTPDGFTAQRLGGKKSEVKKLTPEQVSDIRARYGALEAQDLYFDYSRVPGWMEWMRKAPAIGAASPFLTWQFKALDIPLPPVGIFKPFSKRGLGTSVLTGKRTIGTNSPSVAVNLAREGVYRALRRIAVLETAKTAGREDPLLRRTFSYNAKSPVVTIINKSHTPLASAVSRFSSANWMEPTLNALMLTDSIVGSLTEPELKADFSSAAKIEKLKRRLRKLALEKKDPVPTALNLLGLGGSILFDIYVAALEAEEQGKAFNVVDALVRSYTPPQLRYLYKGQDEFNRGLPLGAKQVDNWGNFYLNSMFSLGYKYADNEKARKRLLSGAKRELDAQLELWKKRRAKELAIKKGDSQKIAQLATEEAKLKALIDMTMADLEVDLAQNLYGERK